MKKLIWSAFALSLILLNGQVSAQTEAVDDFLGLETEILPDLKGKQKFTSPDFNEKETWKVTEAQTIKDVSFPNKGQGYSIIRWNDIDPSEWMSIEKWITERTVKDATPDWQIRLRHADHTELVGKILQCKGTCYVYRGTNKARVQYLSQIVEGDELKTEKDSVAWVFTMDGGLMRVSPETSISFQEINLSEKEIFIMARLNTGHVFWKPQDTNPEPADNVPETDSYSLPLMVREANQEFQERLILKKLTPEQKLSEIIAIKDYAVEDQALAINSFKPLNSLAALSIQTRFMLVSPNATMFATNISFDFVHMTGGSSWFKKRTSSPDGTLEFHLRGYVASEMKTVNEESWFKIEPNGRSFAKTEDPEAELQILELLTKRIKTIELARQIWVAEFTLPVIRNRNSPEDMARLYGYKIWGEELERRTKFLIEYTRRIETTNLRSLENLMVKLEENGEKPRKELSMDLYRASLNHYLLGLKSRYDKKNMRVREMNDLQYYVWILKDGKL